MLRLEQTVERGSGALMREAGFDPGTPPPAQPV